LYARRRIDHGSAGDVLSEVFVIASQRLDEVPSEPLPWLLACARWTLLNHRRAARRRLRLVERLRAEVSDPSPQVEIEQDPSLEAALAALSEPDREALLLTAWEGLSAEQAARGSAVRRRPSGYGPIAPGSAWPRRSRRPTRRGSH
jgi:RNA polymerase sigma-70 factor (ECF subfamily)